MFFSLISIVTGTFLFLLDNGSATAVLGTGYFIFSLLTILNRTYFTIELKKDNNELWLLRAISIILLAFLSILTIQNFYRFISQVQTVMIGYYFISYGLVSFAEMLLFGSINPKAFKKFVDGDYSSMRSLDKVSREEKEIDDIVKNIDKSKKRKKQKSQK